MASSKQECVRVVYFLSPIGGRVTIHSSSVPAVVVAVTPTFGCVYRACVPSYAMWIRILPNMRCQQGVDR